MLGFPGKARTGPATQTTYGDAWIEKHLREHLRRKGRGNDAVTGAPTLRQELQGALESLYGHYRRQYAEWEADREGRENGRTAPVFIVVCNNTNVSKLVYGYVAGHATELAHPDGAPVVVPGELDVFSNVKDQRWLHRPNTILVDSEQFESGEGMLPEFKALAAHQIEEFKAEYRERFPGRDADALTDEDLMREVMNTVGKAGKLGEHGKCVVSVSMLTEGWDVNTVPTSSACGRSAPSFCASRWSAAGCGARATRSTTRTGSTRSTPTCTGCRFRSSRVPGCRTRGRRRSRCRSRAGCGRFRSGWRTGRGSKSPSPTSSATAPRCRPRSCRPRSTTPPA
jgi:hypothetical protein